MNLFIYLVKLIYMIKFLVALAFGILDFCVLDFKSSKRLAVLCEVLLEIQFRIDTGESLELSSSPSHSGWESDSSDDDL